MSDFSIAEAVHNAFQNHAIVDIHTHLYPASMGELYLAGPDELLTYHYLKAECSRMLPEGVAVDTLTTCPPQNRPTSSGNNSSSATAPQSPKRNWASSPS